MISLNVNGKRRELEGPVRLIDFLESSGVNMQFVAVAHNGDVVDRERFAHVVLNDGDVVEVVRPVGGG
ncbi:MAG: sulfur carrier protein ThiS [Chloroflexota bacterium]|nr:sulfur carrier protein ThiS [Chloroflexota bacterium]MDE2942237.1 sulfur carrier protein ThiS [Chloroflexota bacterium]MDE3267704.1 sulfur carrier protein ThiS [Chloroflexota bacterium]